MANDEASYPGQEYEYDNPKPERDKPNFVRVVVSAKTEDLNAIWHSLYKFLEKQFDNVDFEMRNGVVNFFCYKSKQ